VHFQAEISAPFVTCIMTHPQCLLYILAVYNGDKMLPCKNLLILLFKKLDITKFLWGDLETSPPQHFGRPLWSRRLCVCVYIYTAILNTKLLWHFIVQKKNKNSQSHTAKFYSVLLLMHHSNVIDRYRETVSGKDAKFCRQQSAFDVH